jgi:SpoVK/Ycf46/Vps4 family AAA+-type ATPase
MKRLSLVFVFCIGLLGYVSNVPASQGAAPVKASALIAQTAKVGLGQHLVTYLGKLVQSTSSFISKQPTVVKLGAAALAASGLGKLLARGVHWYRTGELGISGEVELSDTFQDALSQWIDLYEAYHNQIEQTKKTIRFMVPALLGWNKFRTLRANRVVQSRAAEEAAVTAAGYFGLLAGLGDFVVEKCAQLVSSIPAPSFLRTSLQTARLNATRALNNVKHIMRTEGITYDDIRKYEEEKHLRLSPELKAQLYDYVQTSSKSPSHKKQAQKTPIVWIGDTQLDIEALIDQIINPEAYKEQGIPFPRGVLMLGDPGLGKTFAARYIAQQAECPIESIKATDLMTGIYVGTYACKVNDLYKRAAKRAKETGKPCIVFIDEADAVLADRQQSNPHQGHSQVNNEILNTLFPLMDGDKTVENVITILASNMPQEFFDKALVERTKRITHIIHMEYPDEARCLQMLRDAAGKHPLTKKLTAEGSDDSLLADLAKRAAEQHFTPDNLYGLMEQLSRTIVAQLSRTIQDEFKKHPNDPNYSRAAYREELQKFLSEFVITKEMLQDEFDRIKDRRRQERSSVAMPQAIPQHSIHMVPQVVPSSQSSAQPALEERRREEQQPIEVGEINKKIRQYQERIGWLQTLLPGLQRPAAQKQASGAVEQQQRGRSSSLSLVAGLIPDALVTRAVRQEQQYQPEGPMLGNRARRSSITGPVGVKVLPDIADRDSAKASVRRMGAQLAQLRRLQDLTAAQTPSGAVVVPVAVPAIMP